MGCTSTTAMTATSTRRYAAKAVLNRYWNLGDCAVAKGRPVMRWVTKVAVTGAGAAYLHGGKRGDRSV